MTNLLGLTIWQDALGLGGRRQIMPTHAKLMPKLLLCSGSNARAGSCLSMASFRTDSMALWCTRGPPPICIPTWGLLASTTALIHKLLIMHLRCNCWISIRTHIPTRKHVMHASCGRTNPWGSLSLSLSVSPSLSLSLPLSLSPSLSLSLPLPLSLSPPLSLSLLSRSCVAMTRRWLGCGLRSLFAGNCNLHGVDFFLFG